MATQMCCLPFVDFMSTMHHECPLLATHEMFKYRKGGITFWMPRPEAGVFECVLEDAAENSLAFRMLITAVIEGCNDGSTAVDEVAAEDLELWEEDERIYEIEANALISSLKNAYSV